MKTQISPQQTLLERMAWINQTVDAALEIHLNDQDFADGREELLHIFCHEACHAALAHCVPWLKDLSEGEHAMVDEVLARLLEKVFAPLLGLYQHNDEEFLVELSLYSVELEREKFDLLKDAWLSTFWPRRDLAAMAAHTLLTLRHGDLVYHILPKADWEVARKAGVYRPTSLEKEGFIHFSRVDQVLQVAQSFYRDQTNLCLLTIAAEKVAGEIRYEDLLGEGMRFPHLYGPLDLAAVVGMDEFMKDEQGDFRLPNALPKEWK